MEVPDEYIGETLLELRTRFSAASTETQVIKGQWEHAGSVYSDELIRAFVDVPDDADARVFFQQFKETLKMRFKQIDIWLVSYAIDIV